MTKRERYHWAMYVALAELLHPELRPLTRQEEATRLLTIWQAERDAGLSPDQRLGGDHDA